MAHEIVRSGAGRSQNGRTKHPRTCGRHREYTTLKVEIAAHCEVVPQTTQIPHVTFVGLFNCGRDVALSPKCEVPAMWPLSPFSECERANILQSVGMASIARELSVLSTHDFG